MLVESKGDFERRKSTGSKVFFIVKCLDVTKLVLLSAFNLLETISPKIWTKPLPKNEKSPLPV